MDYFLLGFQSLKTGFLTCTSINLVVIVGGSGARQRDTNRAASTETTWYSTSSQHQRAFDVEVTSIY